MTTTKLLSFRWNRTRHSNPRIIMEEIKKQRGGFRHGAGRPNTERNVPLLVRITQEAADKLNRLTNNKSAYIDNLIKQQPE